MTTCRSVMMGVGAMQLTALRVTSPDGNPMPNDPAEEEAARVKAQAEALLRERLDLERRKQQSRCSQCERQLEKCILEMKEEIEVQVVGMGLKLAEIVLRHQLPDRSMLEGLIRETLQPISDLHGVRIRVSPAEAEDLKNSDGGGRPSLALSDLVEVVGDPALSEGDLLIESRNGIFDGRLKERLSLLNEKLTERMKHVDADNSAQPS